MSCTDQGQDSQSAALHHSLLPRFYVASQRDGYLDEFLKKMRIPALSKIGVLRSEIKSELLHCWESFISVENVSAPITDVIILHAAAIVNMLQPGIASRLCRQHFLTIHPVQASEYFETRRYWDVYGPNSLKAETRSKRGKGIRR